MSLNPYLWNMYKASADGQKAIKLFSSFNSKLIAEKYLLDYHIDADEIVEWLLDFHEYLQRPAIPEQLEVEDAEALFESIVRDGIQLELPDEPPFQLNANEPLEIIDFLPIISLWLYEIYPDYFKPYLFKNKFKLFTQITDTFGMQLPEVPLKRYKIERIRYYWKICKMFYDFQEANSMTGEEFCAFLYDFAPNYISKEERTDLPEPSQVWLVGGDQGGGDFEFLDRSADKETSFWQGNEDTRRGDIIIMYCLTPRSCIHSIWRATSDGIADPFFHYYSNIYIGHRIKVTPTGFRRIKVVCCWVGWL